MPPPVNEAQPSSQWTGTYLDAGAWACQLTCSWPQALRGAHGGRTSENVRLFNFGTQAEAAAAFDLLAIWRQSQLGKPLTGKRYNLGLQRYRQHSAALLACKSLQLAREHVRQLKDSGVIAALAADVPAPAAAAVAGAGAGVNACSGGSTEVGSKRKRAGSGMVAAGQDEEGGVPGGQEDAADSGKRAIGSSGKQGEGHSNAVDMSEGNECGQRKEEEGSEPGRKHAMETDSAIRGQNGRGQRGHAHGRGGLRGGRGRSRGAATLWPAHGSGSVGFHSVTASPPGWACQVHVSHSRLAGKHLEEVLSSKGQSSIWVAGFGSAAEAAAAGDLALLWRCQAYGGDATAQEGALNFVAAGYKSVPGAAMLRRVLACATAEEVKAALKQMQDEQLFSQLAPALERNPHAVASPLRARPAGGTPGRRGKPVGRGGGRGGRGGPGGHGGRAAAAAAGGSEALAASGRAEGKQQQEVQHQPGVQPQGDVLAEAASPARDDSDLEGANEGLGADRQAQRPGMPAAARAGAVAGGAAAATAAAAAGTPPGAAELFRQLRAVRQSGEEMALELEAALLLTPGLKARHVAAFLARFATVPDMMRVAHFQLMRYAQAAQHDLVCAYVWGFISR
ncbi:hypothetical protein ABPG77_000112 [Micractinium sp. CCAP 211/92]